MVLGESLGSIEYSPVFRGFEAFAVHHFLGSALGEERPLGERGIRGIVATRPRLLIPKLTSLCSFSALLTGRVLSTSSPRHMRRRSRRW